MPQRVFDLIGDHAIPWLRDVGHGVVRPGVDIALYAMALYQVFSMFLPECQGAQ